MKKLQVKVIYATNYINIEKEINHVLDKLIGHHIRDVRINTDWEGMRITTYNW